jgi:hypothetical protein
MFFQHLNLFLLLLFIYLFISSLLHLGFLFDLEIEISIMGALEWDLFKRQWPWWCRVVIRLERGIGCDRFPFFVVVVLLYHSVFVSGVAFALNCSSCLIESWRLSCTHCLLIDESKAHTSNLSKKDWTPCQLLCDCLCVSMGCLVASVCFFIIAG